MEAIRMSSGKRIPFMMRAAITLAFAILVSVANAASPAAAHAGQDVLTVAREAHSSKIGTRASSGDDIMLGVFFNSEKDQTNSIYASYDGKTLYRIAETYKGASTNKPYLANHYAQYDPSIMYHDGYFWSLSGWNKNDGKIWLMISYSKDLITWTHPEGMFGGNGIAVDSYPVDLNGKSLKAFDTVAPEWFVSGNGSIYVIVSAGYYGAFHGKATEDAMQAYSIKVTQLSAGDGIPAGDGYLWPNDLAFASEKAKKLPFTNAKSANFIDGAGYNDGGTDYLIIKKDGLTNQLYKTTDIDEPANWKLVNGKVSHGYEGSSIAKIAGKYFLFGDRVVGATADGVRYTSSRSLTTAKQWASFEEPSFLAPNGKELTARHGSVLTLKAGSAEWQIAKSLLDSKVTSSSYAPKTTVKSAVPAKRAFTVKWAPKASASKYQVRYSTKKSLGGAKIVSASGKATSKKVSKLAAGRKYFVQVRVVNKIGDTFTYSAWSKAKSVTTRK